ncbi:MAG: S-layer homology domain-containing protein [Clostridia bacterium]|nr:S-layer homology domain-containing protein [Clostridia bacterium]
MKKVLVLSLVAILLLSTSVIGVSAMSFTDLTEGHWAYANVQTLVNDGTVRGYEDGSFRPNGTVTRAEFVKMLGVSSVVRDFPYSDVAPEHWAYTYIMGANFPEDNSNLFKPDVPITRGLVAELLWRRGGMQNDTFIPSIITSQYPQNPAAAGWVYATGLMRGDGDGINLRLNDTLSRAEAATLIVRSRTAAQNKATFNQVVNEDVVKNVYNALNLFDGAPYEPNKALTNGEMARAALRIGSEQTTLSYKNLTASADFEHPYAKDLVCVFNPLGVTKLSASFADKKATFADTVSALSYQFIVKANKGQSYGEKTEGLPSNITGMMNVCLTYAKNEGIISLKENLNAQVTVRDFTILCMLYDHVVGTQTYITTDDHPVTAYVKKDQSLLLIPESYGNYRVRVAGLPYALYDASFNDVLETPIQTYDFAREYSSIFMSMLRHLKSTVAQKTGADIRLTYYPSLVCKNSNGYTMRIACDVVSLNGTKAFSELFPVKAGMQGADTPLTKGSRIYFDLSTGSTIGSVTLTSDAAFVDQIVPVQ